MPPKASKSGQGISASRAGTAQKRPPPQTARRGRPKIKSTSGPSRASAAASRSSRTAADTSTASASSIKGKERARQPSTDDASDVSRADDSIASQDTAEWCVAERILLDRTLHLHSISPLHFSALPAAIRKVSPALFRLLRAELFQYVNLRLSDGLGFLEDANTISNARDSTTGDLIPPAKRRRTEMGKVGQVKIDFLKDADFLHGFDRGSAAQSSHAGRPWVIEMELGLPVERDGVGSSRAVANEAQSAELCHIIFLPGRTGSDARLDSHSYPLILTKAPSATLGGDQLLGASSNVGRLVLTHTLDWLQKRFDCRISLGSGAMSIASLLRGAPLEALAEAVVKQTRSLSGAVQGKLRSAKQKQIDALAKPVEMSFGFPARVTDPSDEKRQDLAGPAPELSTLTLTVPWEVCMQLVDGLSADQPLLPALNQYLSTHTSIPLDKLELVRIGVAGINIGVGLGSVRLKMSALPRSVQGEGTGKKARAGGIKESSEEDRTRVGMVVGFLRDLADQRQ